MANKQQLTDLLNLSETVQNLEMGRLSVINTSIRKIEQEIEALRAPETAAADSPYTRAGMDGRRDVWRNQQLRVLNASLAQLRVQHAQQKQKTSRAVGRRLVLEKLKSTAP